MRQKALLVLILVLAVVSLAPKTITITTSLVCNEDDGNIDHCINGECSLYKTCENGCEKQGDMAYCIEPEEDPDTSIDQGTCADFTSTPSCDGPGCDGNGEYVQANITGDGVVDTGESASYTAMYDWFASRQDRDSDYYDRDSYSSTQDRVSYSIKIDDGSDTLTTCASGDGSTKTLSCSRSVDGQIAVVAQIKYDTYGVSRCIETRNPQTCDDLSPGAMCGDDITNGSELICTDANRCCPRGQYWTQEGDGKCVDKFKETDTQNDPRAAPTNALVINASGNAEIHLCGTHWDVDESITQHDLCSQVTDNASHKPTYRCSVNETGWLWTQTHKLDNPSNQVRVINGIPEMTASNDEIWNNIYNGLNKSTTQLNETVLEGKTSVACNTTGGVVQGIQKQELPGTSTGSCAQNQCYADGKCYEQGALRESHVCGQSPDPENDQAVWQGVSVALAEELLATAKGKDVLLNCGTNQTVTNIPARGEYAYCELAIFNSYGEIHEVIVGTVFKDGINESFLKQVKRINSSFNATDTSGVYDEQYINVTNHPYAPHVTMAYFTNQEAFNTQKQTLWERFVNFFTEDTDLPSHTSNEFYLYTPSDHYAWIEYDQELGNPEYDDKVMIDETDEPRPYTPYQWKQVIQRR